eukprot:TRINITY_DN11276_c0_g1_i10.p1 TRINITY_DN11276_c0_g1~~TRINITY_DN11276_c0_g1_i10.p1  ORF type:complete len:896 (+),score=206.23 TRINITY_DN11276_c0_g1_i10:79-2766(+)
MAITTRLKSLRLPLAAIWQSVRGLATDAPVVAIRRETKNRWERRAPLTPSHVRTLARQGVQVVVQPSPMRVFTDEQYASAGAVIREDLSDVNTILAVKEVPIDELLPNKTYVCFSHTIKAQPSNMAMLDAILERNIRLIDYECVVDDTGRRLIGFGRYAGVAGMIDLLRGLGDRLLGLGHSNPFLASGYSDYYHSVAAARTAIQLVGHNIVISGTPKAFPPMIFGFTGAGNVTKGAVDIFQELPHEWIDVSDLDIVAETGDRSVVYGVMFKREHLAEPIDPKSTFVKEHYDANPHLYKPRFHRDFAPKITALVNCMYWDHHFPRLLSDEQLRDLYHNPQSQLLAIADISADPYGSIEATRVCTSIDKPFLVHSPDTDEQVYNWEADGILLGSVDNLPAELPIESSQEFGDKLFPFVRELALTDPSVAFSSAGLQPALSNAVIASNGALTPNFTYIADLRAKNEAAEQVGASSAPAFIAELGAPRVTLFGAGMVAGSYVHHLSALRDKLRLNVVSDDESAARRLSPNAERLHVTADGAQERIATLAKESDVVVSLLPAQFHVPLAEACIAQGCNMVTTSYVSPEMQALHASAGGITILNECGLDPGLDHFLAVDLFDSLQQRGLHIKRFESWCGGLPAPHCAGPNNPLNYKFSWSPRGVLVATNNGAKFQEDGEVKVVNPGELFDHVRPVQLGLLNLVGTPNRDSTVYQELYDLDPIHLTTILRGTLRYPGFWETIRGLEQDGVLNSEPGSKVDWGRLSPTSEKVLRNIGIAEADLKGATAMDQLANALWQHLQYKADEQDMVVLQHVIDAGNADAKVRVTAEVQLLGDKHPHGLSAMARTVGAPAALATHYLLDNDSMVTNKGVLRPLDVSLARRFLKDLEGHFGITHTASEIEL